MGERLAAAFAGGNGKRAALDGTPLVLDDADGWILVDDHTIELQGAACQTVLNDDTVSLSAYFPCGIVIG